MKCILTSESVTEGHPDKVCDFMADSILDACLARDPASRVACEVPCKGVLVVLAGEITCAEAVDYEAIGREAVRSVGYVDLSEAFHADGLRFETKITRQSREIGESVDTSRGQGAGHQGLMFSYATDDPRAHAAADPAHASPAPGFSKPISAGWRNHLGPGA